MKLVYVLPVLLSIVILSGTQAFGYEMYEGDISLKPLDSDSTNGVTYHYDGKITIYELEPQVISEPSGNIDIKLLDSEGIVLDNFTTPIDSAPIIDPDGGSDKWAFSFEIDTSKYDLMTDVEYTVQASYLHMVEEKTLTVYPTLEKSIVDAGIAKAERDNIQALAQPIPDWVKNIFVFYANDEISDSELISAIQYLIDVNILKV